MEIKKPKLITTVKEKEIIDGLLLLCAIYAGSFPLNRDFGIDPDILSQPLDLARAMFTQDIVDKTEKFIPEIIVTEVDFEDGEIAALYPIIHFEEKEEVDNEFNF